MADEDEKMSLSERLMWGFLGILFLWMMFATTAQAAPLNASLSAYYRFDNNVLDIFRNNTMTVTGSVDYNATCKLNGCYKFDGANDVFVTTRGWKWTRANSHSYAFWLLSADTGATDKIWYHANTSWGYDLIQISDAGGGVRNVTFFGSSTAYPVAINKSLVNSGTWRHIIVAINSTGASGVVSIYVDGTLRRQKTVNMQVAISTESFFGAQGFAGNRYQGHLDELSTWNKTLNSGEVAYLYNSGSARGYNDIMSSGAPPAVTSAITFYKPDRPDILNYSTRTLFKVSGSKATYSNVNITINGVKVKTYATLANNTNQTYWFNSSEGNITIGVYANNTFNATKVFRHLFYNVTDRDFRTSVNETTLQETNITIATGTGITAAVNLTIEGLATENITGASVVDGKWRAYYYAMVPAADGATKTIWWNITLRLPDGTVQKNRTSYAVAHHFGYNITGIRIKGKTNYAKAWAGELMPGSLYVKLPTQTARNGNLSVLRYNNGTAANWAYFSDTGGTNTTLHSSFAAPDVSIWNATKIFKYTMRVTDQYGNSRNSTWQRYARIYAPNQTTFWNTNGALGMETGTYCNSGGDADAWSLTARDESDASRLYNPNMNIILKFWKNSTVIKKKSWTWNNTGLSNLSICNYPYNFSNSPNVNSSLRMNATVTVTHTGYSSTLWTITNALVNATSPSRYAIYLINSSVSTPITFYLYGNYDAPLEGYTLKVQKYYTGTGAYIDVFSGIADYEGKVTAYLQTYLTYYNYIIQDENGTVVKEYSPSTIATSPVYLRVTEGSENWPSTYYGISHDCAWSNTTKLLICTVNDPAGKVVTSTLTVERNVLFTNITECTTSASGSAVTLTCNLVNATGNMYWVLTTDITGYSEYVLEAGNIDGAMSAATFGSTGTLAAIILMVSLGFGGFAMGGTAAGIAGALIGGVIMGYFGAFPALGPAEGTVIAGAFILLLIVALVVDR